ncbi:MAG: TSUP family transporter, partial [Candidatus Kapaibacterium sp.]
GVGLLTGLVGVGGGFMIVPVLSLILGMEMAKSVGTSLFVIAVNSLFGSIGYFSQPDLAAAMSSLNVGSLSITSFVLMFLGCMFLGVWTGSALSSRVRAATLKRMFGVLLLVVATMMIAQRLGMW